MRVSAYVSEELDNDQLARSHDDLLAELQHRLADFAVELTVLTFLVHLATCCAFSFSALTLALMYGLTDVQIRASPIIVDSVDMDQFAELVRS